MDFLVQSHPDLIDSLIRLTNISNKKKLLTTYRLKPQSNVMQGGRT